MPNNAQTFANNAITTLANTAFGSDGTITVQSASGFPTTGPYTIVIDNELLLVTAGFSTTTWTVTRSQEGTSAAQHNAGSTITQEVTKAGLDSLGSGYYSTFAPGGIGNANLAAGRYAGFTASGPPTTGTFNTGDLVPDQIGRVFICTAGGTPGTWTALGVGNVYCQVNLNAATTSFSNSINTIVPFDTKVNDPSASFSTSTHLWTCPIAGLYRIDAQIEFQNLAGGLQYNPAIAYIYKNGSELKRCDQIVTPANPAAVSPGAHTTERFAAGDTISIWGLQTSSAAANVLGGNGGVLTWLTIGFEGGN